MTPAAHDEPGRDPRLLGRRIVLGVAGGIAAYKAVEVCRRFMDAGAFVSVVLTDDAQRFVGALTFSALASEPVRTSLFDGPDPIPHTKLGQGADAIVVAPATAKVIGKYAAGISDDLLTATLLATRAPVVVCPAMHTEMWDHAAVQANIRRLRERGVIVVEPASGRLAGGDIGAGRLAEPTDVVNAVAECVAHGRDLGGLRVLVTAGGTREPIDPVRIITNRSSGKQGYALARAAFSRGAAVTLVTTVERHIPAGVELVRVNTAAEMEAAVVPRAGEYDAIIMAAAVADFRPKVVEEHKIKKGETAPEIILEPTHDFLVDLGASKPAGQVLVGFAAETTDLVQNARSKLRAKRLDLIVANDVSAAETGFESDNNRATLLDDGGGTEELPLMTKREMADAILDRVRDLLEERP